MTAAATMAMAMAREDDNISSVTTRLGLVCLLSSLRHGSGRNRHVL